MSNFINYIKEKQIEELEKAQITVDDIQDFAKCYQEVLDSRISYMKATVGRKELASDIEERLSVLKSFLNYLTNSVIGLDNDLSYVQHYVSDYKMALRLLLRLANEKDDKFILKRFVVTDIVSFEKQHGDREYENISGNIWVIGEKAILDKIDDKEYYFGCEFKKVANDILKQGYSLVIMTDYNNLDNVIPSNYNYGNIQRVNIQVANMFSDMICYLYDDNLKRSVDKFESFINKNGADIKGIDENTLFDIVRKINVSSDKNLSEKLILVKKDN